LTRLWEEVAGVLKSLEQEEELEVGELLEQIWKRLLKLQTMAVMQVAEAVFVDSQPMGSRPAHPLH
jgi:hypothetical protein